MLDATKGKAKNVYMSDVGVDVPSELNVLAAQVAGVASIITMSRIQIDNDLQFNTDALYLLETQLQTMNIRICELSDLLVTLF